MSLCTRLRWLQLALALALVLPAGAHANADDDDDQLADPGHVGKTPRELWAQVDEFFLRKNWQATCLRLDRLLAAGEDVKGKAGRKAGYAYVRCAQRALRKMNLTDTDRYLEQSVDVAGLMDEQKPVEAYLHRALARLALERGDLAQALAHYEIAVAKNPEAKEEHDASLRLTTFARAAYDRGERQAARDAVTAALLYYPESRDALALQEQLNFWSSTGKYLLIAMGLVVFMVVALQLRRKAAQAPDPYDPYSTPPD